MKESEGQDEATAGEGERERGGRGEARREQMERSTTSRANQTTGLEDFTRLQLQPMTDAPGIRTHTGAVASAKGGKDGG